MLRAGVSLGERQLEMYREENEANAEISFKSSFEKTYYEGSVKGYIKGIETSIEIIETLNKRKEIENEHRQDS